MALEPLTRPAGFDWRTDIALVGGFAAKEVIVATLGTAYSLGDIDPEDPTPLAQQIRNDGRWTPATALALLVFVLLYAPCLVTVAAIRQETGSWGWPVFSMVFNMLICVRGRRCRAACDDVVSIGEIKREGRFFEKERYTRNSFPFFRDTSPCVDIRASLLVVFVLLIQK